MEKLPNINKGMKKLILLNSHFKSNTLEIKIHYKVIKMAKNFVHSTNSTILHVLTVFGWS